MNYISDKEYDSKLHDGWKQFGDHFFESKKDLLAFLAINRKYKDTKGILRFVGDFLFF